MSQRLLRPLNQVFRTKAGYTVVGTLSVLLAGCALNHPSLTLTWQQELFVQRSACAEHHYAHRAVSAHLDGLPCEDAERLSEVTWCADGFCQTARRDGHQWGYDHLFGETVHHEQFRVFHNGLACEATVLFYPPESWVPGAGRSTLRWAQQGRSALTSLDAQLPPLVRRAPLTLDVWKASDVTDQRPPELCARTPAYLGPGAALLTLQTKPPGRSGLYVEQETTVGVHGAQACMPLNGSRYAAAFVFVHTDDANVEHKLEIDNPDASMFACGDGSQRPNRDPSLGP